MHFEPLHHQPKSILLRLEVGLEMCAISHSRWRVLVRHVWTRNATSLWLRTTPTMEPLLELMTSTHL